MAFPPQHKTSKMDELDLIVSRSGPEGFEALQREDHILISQFIQTYNHIELNLRRALSMFLANGTFGVSSGYVPTAQLVEKIKKVVLQLDGGVEPIADSLAKLDEIEFRRSFRNALAHCAAQRVKDRDSLVLYFTDSKDAQKNLGAELDFNTLGYMLLDLADLRGLLVHISSYEKWIALKIPEWFSRYSTE